MCLKLQKVESTHYAEYVFKCITIILKIAYLQAHNVLHSGILGACTEKWSKCTVYAGLKCACLFSCNNNLNLQGN